MDYDSIIRFTQSLEFTPDAVDRLYEFLLAAFQVDLPPYRETRHRGTLISFDGHSGAGKDTQIARLQSFLQTRGYAARLTTIVTKKQDPFRTVSKYLWTKPSSEANARCAFLLLSAGRKYVAETLLSPLLEQPAQIVLQNRSYLSHIAYHATHDGEIYRLLQLCPFDLRADLSLVLTCQTAVAYRRIEARAALKGGVINRNERPDYIERVKHNLSRVAAFVDRVELIETSGDVGSVSNRIAERVSAHLAERQA